MAYEAKNLSVLAYANGFTLWHYTTGNATILSPGYFASASDMLRKGDLIIATVDAAGTPDAEMVVVRSASGGSVVVADVMQP
jgi:hypothetical protein